MDGLVDKGISLGLILLLAFQVITISMHQKEIETEQIEELLERIDLCIQKHNKIIIAEIKKGSK